MNCVLCGKAVTPRFALCKGCLELYGERREWPAWLKFLADDEKKVRRQLAMAPNQLAEDFDEGDGGAGVIEALSMVRVADLFKESGLTKSQIAVVALRVFGGFTEEMVVQAGPWTSQQAVSGVWTTALRKMRKTLQQEADMDKYQVRVELFVSVTGISAGDRPAAQAVAETLVKQLAAATIPMPEGVSFQDVAIATSSIQGPSVPRRPMQARFGYPDMTPTTPIDLGVAR